MQVNMVKKSNRYISMRIDIDLAKIIKEMALKNNLKFREASRELSEWFKQNHSNKKLFREIRI